MLMASAKEDFGLFTVIAFLLIFATVYFNKFFVAVKNGYIRSPFERDKMLKGTPYILLSFFYLLVSILSLFIASFFINALFHLGIYHFR